MAYDEHQIDSLAVDAIFIFHLMEVAADIMRDDLSFVTPDGKRNRAMDKLNALIVLGAERQQQLADAIDALPRPSAILREARA